MKTFYVKPKIYEELTRALGKDAKFHDYTEDNAIFFRGLIINDGVLLLENFKNVLETRRLNRSKVKRGNKV